jgi:hypothetical protein
LGIFAEGVDKCFYFSQEKLRGALISENGAKSTRYFSFLKLFILTRWFNFGKIKQG